MFITQEDMRIDCWGLGITLYELLTLRKNNKTNYPIVELENETSFISNVMNEISQASDDGGATRCYSSDLCDLVARLLAVSTLARPFVDDVLNRAFAHLVSPSTSLQQESLPNPPVQHVDSQPTYSQYPPPSSAPSSTPPLHSPPSAKSTQQQSTPSVFYSISPQPQPNGFKSTEEFRDQFQSVTLDLQSFLLDWKSKVAIVEKRLLSNKEKIAQLQEQKRLFSEMMGEQKELRQAEIDLGYCTPYVDILVTQSTSPQKTEKEREEYREKLKFARDQTSFKEAQIRALKEKLHTKEGLQDIPPEAIASLQRQIENDTLLLPQMRHEMQAQLNIKLTNSAQDLGQHNHVKLLKLLNFTSTKSSQDIEKFAANMQQQLQAINDGVQDKLDDVSDLVNMSAQQSALGIERAIKTTQDASDGLSNKLDDAVDLMNLSSTKSSQEVESLGEQLQNQLDNLADLVFLSAQQPTA